MQPSKVGSLLASDASLQPVVEKARQISALSKLCFDFLPPGLARLVRAITFTDRHADRQLVLLTASPAAAAKLKLLSEALLTYLLQQGAQVNSVSVRVQPGGVPPVDAAARQAPRLSQSALEAL
ncbi:MAG: DciA family protein, partial [Pseudomonadota bacterium]